MESNIDTCASRYQNSQNPTISRIILVWQSPVIACESILSLSDDINRIVCHLKSSNRGRILGAQFMVFHIKMRPNQELTHQLCVIDYFRPMTDNRARVGIKNSVHLLSVEIVSGTYKSGLKVFATKTSNGKGVNRRDFRAKR